MKRKNKKGKEERKERKKVRKGRKEEEQTTCSLIPYCGQQLKRAHLATNTFA